MINTLANNKKIALCITLFVLLVLQVSSIVPARASSFPGENGKVFYVDSSGHVAVAKNDGTNPTDLKNVNANSVSVSPNGLKIAYSAPNGGASIHVANIDGTNDVTLPSGGGVGDYYPSWSPDGKKLAFTGYNGSEQIFTMNADDGSNRTQLTNESLDNEYPTWSPDGTKILYQKTAGGNGVDIYVMNANGSNKTALAASSDHELHARWSPDGTRIVYKRFIDNTYGYDIYKMNSDGSNQTRLAARTQQDDFPEYSPDGTKIFFLSESNGFGAYRLYRMDADGTNAVKLSNSILMQGFEVQPLALGPTATTPNQTVTVSQGKATVDVPALYSDPYGAGVNSSSVTVASAPSYGTTQISNSGVITYTQQVASAQKHSFLNTVSSWIFPRVSAAAATDSFTYRVCSNSGSSLCSTGTITVNLASATAASVSASSTGAPNTGYGAPGSALSEFIIWAGLISTVAGFVQLKRSRK